MSGLQVQFVVDKDDVKLIGQSQRKIEAAAARMTARLLDIVEDSTLITQYTQTAKPAKPTGSVYIRTFRLQRSSEKTMVKRNFPIEGKWEAKTEYASFVLGPASGQAAIHSGRWPPLEVAINRVNANSGKIFDEEVNKEKL